MMLAEAMPTMYVELSMPSSALGLSLPVVDVMNASNSSGAPGTIPRST